MKTPRTFMLELAALQHIAACAAAVRGHELGEWQVSENFAQVRCNRCQAALRVSFPALQPEIDGSALEQACAVCEWAA